LQAQPFFFVFDPCRLVRQVKQFAGWVKPVATELLHLPDKPAGVENNNLILPDLATELLHLPDKPAGVATDFDFGRQAACRSAST
jgi:hypothetical protein